MEKEKKRRNGSQEDDEIRGIRKSIEKSKALNNIMRKILEKLNKM